MGIIGDVIAPDAALQAAIRRALGKISEGGPFPPLVLHYCSGAPKTANMTAREYASARSNWQVQRQAESSFDVAGACHILIVIARGTETDPGPKPSNVWKLVKRARASGRTIVHVQVTSRTPGKPRPRAASPRPRNSSDPSVNAGRKPDFKPPMGSYTWAMVTGHDDRKAGRAQPRYQAFLTTYGLPDSPRSKELWQLYRKAAAVVRDKDEVREFIPKQGRRRRNQTVPRPTRRMSAERTVSDARSGRLEALTQRNNAALSKLNPTDPEVWR